MNIHEYIKTLTPEEREKHADLIKECVERDADLEKYFEILKKKFAEAIEIYYYDNITDKDKITRH